MSARRSSRLASKATPSSGNGRKAELIFEENSAQHVNLKSHTPRTPYQRSTQKRKRGTSASVTVTSTNVDSTAIVNVDGSAENNVFTQSRPTTVPDIVSRNESLHASSPMYSPMSQGELLAIEEIESNAQGPGTSRDVKRKNSGDSNDGFGGGDGASILDMLPNTPENVAETPRRSLKPVIASRRLSSETDSHRPVERKPLNDYQTAKEFLEESAEQAKGSKSKRSMKNSSNGVEKKKTKVNNPGQRAQGKKKKKNKFKLAFTNRKAVKEMANSATNELSLQLQDLSFMSTQEKLQLSSWGLPVSILNNYRSKGITSLFNWQLECLENVKVLEGTNLLYSAPTSAGKTLVSEILMVKRVLELGRKAIMILPFVSVAREKVYSLQSIFGDAGIRVEGFMGSINPPGGFKAVDIAVCTIEKANSLINKLLEENALGDLGTLVVDELHLIGDSNRGYLLELLLTKIIYMTSVKNNMTENSLNVSEGPSWRTKRSHIQVIGMSATLPNLDVLAKWLNAELYVTDFRPVPLKACLKVEDKLYDEKLELVRTVKTEDIPINIDGDIEDIVYLSLETVLNGFSVLIFCSSRNLVEKIASKIADSFFKIGSNITSSEYAGVAMKLRNSLDTSRIQTVVEQLRQCPGGSDKVLSKTVMFGVGYHHAGLTYENRDIVESAFKRGILKVIVATSTLSAGVNLPARRVMIHSPVFGKGVLDTMVYHQMCGRAGRNGIDTEGESILLCPPQFKDIGKGLFQGEMPKVKSALIKDGSLTSSMKRALLEVIASGVALLTSDVKLYAKCTFLFHSLDSGVYESNELSLSQVHKDTTVDECLKYLEEQDFIRVKKYEQEDKPDEFMPTQLGSACLAASFSPDEGIMVYRELSRARGNFVLENELHVIYQVTPIYVTESMKNIDWHIYLNIFESLDSSEKKVAGLIGVTDTFIIRAMTGVISAYNESYKRNMGIHQRFFAALALSDLVNERSLDYVGEKFLLNKGTLQSLQTQASTFAGMVTAFCGRLGWSNLELLLSQFQERLEFGVQRELCDLVRLDCLNGQRARILYDAGLKTIMDLAAADPAQVEHILHKSTPFNSNVHGGKESSIWMIGKETLSEAQAAQKIVQEARVFIQIELGNQGNIQFAFGNNDAPVFSSKRHTQTGHDKVVKKSVMIDESKTRESDDKNINGDEDVNDGVSSKLGSNLFKSEIDGVIGNRRKDEEEKNIIIDQDYSERQEFEKPDVKLFENQNNPDDDELFEDSFPDMIPADISKVYPKYHSEVDAIAPKKFSISQEMEKVALGKLSRNILKTHDEQIIHKEMQNGHGEATTKNPQVQHSTPLIPASSSKRQRFTLNQDGNTSPVPNLSPVKDKEKLREMNGKEVAREDLELSHGILAEFDNAFSSSVDCLESSVDFNADNAINNISAKKNVQFTTDEKKENGDAKSASVLLNESLAAAMQAFDDDTQFESEELFTDVPAPADAPVVPAAVAPNVILIPEDARCDDFDEEDFIMTQQFSEEELIEKVDDDVLEGRSSDSELTSAWSENSAFNQLIFEDPSEIVVTEIKVGKAKITVKTVKSVDAIPTAFFSGSEMIGVGMKLVSQKKPSGLSIARRGIGARVVAKNATLNNSILAPGESYHSLAVYNGRDTVWVLRWENENGLRVGGSKKHSSNNNESPLDRLLGKVKDNRCALAIFDCKEKIKNLLKHCGSQVLSKLPQGKGIWDPRIAQWMWDFDDEDWNVSKRKLIDEYVSEEEKVISKDTDKEIVEAFLVWKVMTALKEKLLGNGLWNHFIKTEMPSIVPLLLMEMNGLGLDSFQLSNLKRVLQFKSALLELKAFQIAGRQFNLNSPKDIKQILFREIGLKQPKGKGTGKDVLLKLDHELPGIIVEWRKVNSALQKVVIPFQQERNLETGRVHGQYSHFTVTGRVVMSDPSLQCIPRDFDIMISYDSKELDEVKNNCRLKFGSKLSALFQQLDSSVVDIYVLNNISLISMRNAFVPCNSDFVILTADYSQLELRILAHLSGDTKLLEALNKGTDVFVEIASQWKKVPKDQVTSTMRQEAKGIVYGVIYGMGARTLAEQMEIEEREAAKFITQFLHTYPAINSFIERASKKCLEKGYVETMTGRRRYLPLIYSRHPQEKAKAIRQAVNTQIQGSAADLVKSAMTRIYSFLQSTYPKSALPIEWNKLCKAQRSSISMQGPVATTQLDDFVFFPILNLHDELIFEVRKTFLEEIATVVKREMESCVSLNVKLPVVIKVGESWGNMKVYGDVD